MNASIYLKETIATFQQYQRWANEALAQLTSDEPFFHVPGPRSNSIALIIKHVAGNLRSRWRHFLTEDGEKPDRHRDNEFILEPGDTRDSLMQRWNASWNLLYQELSALNPDDMERIVTIRTEPHTVTKAIQRSLAHVAFHVGQIMYLCRLQKQGDWKWITIAPGESQNYNEKLAAK